MYQYLQSEQEIVVDNLSMYLEEIIMVSLRYKNNPEFYRIAEDESLNTNERLAAFREAALEIQPPVKAVITNVYLVDNEDNLYLISGDTEIPIDISSVELASNAPYYNVGEIVYDIEGNYYLPISMEFYNYQTYENIGHLVICIPENSIAELFQELFCESERSFLIDEEGMVLSHNGKEQIGINIKELGIVPSDEEFLIKDVKLNGEDCIVVTTELGNSSKRIGFPWKLCTAVPYNVLNQNIEHIQFLLLVFSAIVAILASILSFHLSAKLTDAIKRLGEKIKSINADNLKQFLDPSPRDELWELEQGYNEMLKRINDLLEKNKQEQIKKRELEFTALQAQINPHFLYNTLDTIGWIATLKNQPEIEQMVMELSRFFRLCLHKGDELVTLEDELGIVSSYLKIEQLRNPGKFDVVYEIQEDLLQIKVPKIMLQPIVENSIKHGISQVRRHGLITIRGYHIDDDVYLEIQDNGNGIQSKSTQLKGSNYGLKNIRERIQLEYGKQYGLSIESREGEGTTVQIHISFEG